MPAANPWKKQKEDASKAKKVEEPPPEPPPEPAPAVPEDPESEHHPGRIKNMAGFFATQTGESKVVRKKRLEIDDTPETIIRESEPAARIEGVIRSDDPGEWQKPIELEKGWAKNMANMFLNK